MNASILINSSFHFKKSVSYSNDDGDDDDDDDDDRMTIEF